MDKAERFWDKMSRNYDKSESISDVNEYKSIGYIREYLNDSDTVMDFGCATGTIASALAVNVKEMYGVDLSPKMIEIAKMRAAERGIENIHFSHVSIFDDEYKKRSFNMVVSYSVLHLLDDAEAILRRISELVVPGGHFISLTPCLGERKLVGAVISVGKKIGVIPHINRFKMDGLVQIIAHAGFEIVTAQCIDNNPLEYFIMAKKPETAG